MVSIEHTSAGMLFGDRVIRWPVIARIVARYFERNAAWFKTDGMAIRVKAGVAEFVVLSERWQLDIECLRYALHARNVGGPNVRKAK